MLRSFACRALVLPVVASFMIAGCSGNKPKVSTPKEAADLFIESLRKNDFDKFFVLIPTKSEIKYMISKGTRDESEKRKALARVDKEFNDDYVGKLKTIFENIRTEYGPGFWQDAKVTGYEGLETEKSGEFEATELYIELQNDKIADRSKLELKLGEMIKLKGRWLVFTEPRWL